MLAFQCGETTESERQRIHRHMDSCEHCRALLVMTAAMDDGPAHVELDSMERLASIVGSGLRLTTFAEGKLLAHRFEVTRFVERGGMGEVYEAFDRGVGSRVALKALLCTTDDTPETSRLGEEVKLARRVAHLNVCRIYDLHEHREPGHQPLRFLAMEFVDGSTLKEHLMARELSIDEACAIARQLLEGLGAVHSAGVLHLDFKSQNVMLRQGVSPAQPVVMDFSLSRAFEKELHLRTSERRVAGSIGYMSPEQLECRPTIGPAADVYAFGVVFYEMLTRRMPFGGDSPAAIMLKQLKAKAAPPSSLRPAVSTALDTFVLTCLSRHSRARFQDAAQAIEALNRCMLPAARVARGQGTPWRKMLAVAVLAGASVGALVHFASPAPAERGPTEGGSESSAQAAPAAGPARDDTAEATAIPGDPRVASGGSPGPSLPAHPPVAREEPRSVPAGGAPAPSPRPRSSQRHRLHPTAPGEASASQPPTLSTPTNPPPPAAAPSDPQPDRKAKWVPSSAPDFLL